MESDKDLIRKKAVSWLNKQTYPPRKPNHFKVIAFIFGVVVCLMCLLIVVVVDFGEDIDLYFSSMRTQLYLIIGLLPVLAGFSIWVYRRNF